MLREKRPTKAELTLGLAKRDNKDASIISEAKEDNRQIEIEIRKSIEKKAR